MVNNIKYTLDLPILKDSDPEVQDHLETCELQLAQANNGKGVNMREKAGFIRGSLEKNGTRRASWDLLSKQLQENGLLQKDPAEAYKQLVADLKQVIPETALETNSERRPNSKLWNRPECDTQTFTLSSGAYLLN